MQIMTPEDHDRNLLEIEQIRATITKMIAEQAKLLAEQAKLNAERTKLDRENRLGNFGVPAIATLLATTVATLLGGMVTLAVTLLRHT